tara:strand:- start:218 stop:919 length:702 start_codon:yes stop_codon:yes gene_type:complete
VNYFVLPRKAARLIVLQRIELTNLFLTKIRKILGRYIFSSFVTKYFLNSKDIGKKYYETMLKEFLTIEKFINQNDKYFLSIGGGMGGLELIINENFKNKDYFFIERNYVSKKVKYGWGGMINDEAYNDLELQEKFLLENNMHKDQINIFDYDQKELPEKKFDIIISLLSLDYHYDFDIYSNYLKKVSNSNTKIIFDTIRADHFKKIFKHVEVIRTDSDTIHKSKRIICREFLN